MKQVQFYGGILLALLGALLMFLNDAPAVIPVAITLGIVGIALIASARRIEA